ncbi:hypothetical protein SeMB42_g01802 [Synchytrium endobioticum]|uniref:HAMP domain-containing protein n=1 Tax=Synchytrium endobioticum TaxID=286115 RepID=A0A507DKW8_9FUNG|nr:hypothetical protein SeLEV6574_g02918 [Synchytrium endobioticum]TPX51895.1 hypothetical protein SeMB42_g01802 [Synchytrium endobioticum]
MTTNQLESALSDGAGAASISTSASRPLGFQIRIPLWSILLGWTILFAGGLSLSIGLIMADASSTSLVEVSDQLRKYSMDEATAAINSSLLSMESVLIAVSEDYQLLSFVNSDPDIGATGLTSLDLFSAQAMQLAGKFKSACSSIKVCHVVGVWIADNAILSYTSGNPAFFTVQDQSTLAAGNYSNRYTVVLDVNATATLDSSTFMDRNVITTFNSSNAFATLGLFDYLTSLFWAELITGSSNFGYNRTYLSYDHHILAMRPIFYNLPYGLASNQHYQAVARASMSISSLEEFMQDLNATDNGILFAIDPTWYMISASRLNISVVNYGRTRWLCSANPNQLVADSCTFLNTTYAGNMTAIPAEGLQITFQSAGSGTVFLDVRWIKRTNLDWLVISAIPRSDIYAAVDSANMHVTIAAVILSVVGLVLSFALAIAVTRPLKTLQRMMMEARSLRFQEIRDEDYLNKRSILAELASMEDTFHHMLKKFAEGIQANRSLVPRKSPSANQHSSMGGTHVGASGCRTAVAASMGQLHVSAADAPNSNLSDRKSLNALALGAIRE